MIRGNVTSISLQSPWIQRLIPYLPATVSAVFIVLIAFTLAALSWRVLTPPRPPFEAHTPGAPAQKVQRTQPDHARNIADRHLLGTPPSPTQQSDIAAPDTKLNLVLRGVLSTEDLQALAIIAMAGATEKIYAIGDDVPGGARLKTVYADRVILERGANLETLRLPKDRAKGFSLEEHVDETEAPPPAPFEPVTTGDDLGQTLQSYREDLLKNPSRLMSLLQADPVMQNGSFVGFRLRPKTNDPLFKQLGLRPGDIVTHLNGVELNSPERGIKAMRDLIDASELTLTIERAGSRMDIQHQIGG